MSTIFSTNRDQFHFMYTAFLSVHFGKEQRSVNLIVFGVSLLKFQIDASMFTHLRIQLRERSKTRYDLHIYHNFVTIVTWFQWKVWTREITQDFKISFGFPLLDTHASKSVLACSICPFRYFGEAMWMKLRGNKGGQIWRAHKSKRRLGDSLVLNNNIFGFECHSDHIFLPSLMCVYGKKLELFEADENSSNDSWLFSKVSIGTSAHMVSLFIITKYELQARLCVRRTAALVHAHCLSHTHIHTLSLSSFIFILLLCAYHFEVYQICLQLPVSIFVRFHMPSIREQSHALSAPKGTKRVLKYVHLTIIPFINEEYTFRHSKPYHHPNDHVYGWANLG